MGWVFATICVLIMFWSVEIRFKEIYKKLGELKDITEKSIDQSSTIKRQLEDWKRFLK